LILDEPTDGLDPNQKHEVRRLINELSKDKLVIVSTHILEEVHEVCTRAIIIAERPHRGRRNADRARGALALSPRRQPALRQAEQLEAARREIAAAAGSRRGRIDARELRSRRCRSAGANALPR
jgi:ABC-2 type transport system ATP-binding protein